MRLWFMTLLTGTMAWAALSSLSTGADSRISSSTIAQASGVVAVLAIFGLRSVPVRWIVRGLALFSGALLARFGQLGTADGLAGSWRVLVWLGALGVALTLAPSSRSVLVDSGEDKPAGRTSREDKLAGRSSGGDSGGSDSRRKSAGPTPAMGVFSDTRGRIPVAIAVAAISFVAGLALLVGPRASNWFPSGTKAGDLIDHARNNADNVLVSRESLDMTSRPKLSDKVIMTVRSPIVSLWRAELFDRWDGSTWTRTYANQGTILNDGVAVAYPDDIAAAKGSETTQEFRLETGFATVMPSAASPVQVTSSNEVAQRSDGTLVSAYRPLGSGTTYTVKSRQMPVDEAVLRSAGSAKSLERSSPIAAQVMAQHGMLPATTDRVMEVARSQTAGADNDFDRILAIERWMSTNNTYSLEAPLSPKGVDVVDHFLFEQREGWCEQIASSLVVMARSVGVPARLATGYAPGEWDAAGGRFIVRERDAHAWAEVWFPGQGWVAFDPTASVPLSGTQAATAGADARDWREVLGMVLVLVGIVSVSAGPVTGFVRRLFESIGRRRESAKLISTHWELGAAQRLERIGARLTSPREPSDSFSRYGREVAESVGDQRFVEVGESLDRVLYGAPPAGEVRAGAVGREHGSEREHLDHLLTDLENSHP